MCFSAPVSFAASAVLVVTGLLAVRQTRTSAQWPFAAIPLLFGVQQAIEGLLWLWLPTRAGHPGGDLMAMALTQAYAAFVGIVWPMLVPISLLAMEKDVRSRWMLMCLAGLGTLIAAYTLTVILVYGVTVTLSGQCLVYQNPAGVWPGMIAIYVAAVCGPFFASSDRGLHAVGIVNLIGFAVAATFYRLNFPSIWCFFAALISILIWFRLWLAARPVAVPSPQETLL